MKRINLTVSFVCLLFAIIIACALLYSVFHSSIFPSTVTPPSSGLGGTTITAASCAESDVQNAINLAQNGYTIVVPAGRCEWTWQLVISASSRSLTLAGSGIGKTIIVDGTPYNNSQEGRISMLVIGTQLGYSFRLTNFTFTYDPNISQINYGGTIYLGGTSQNFRIDHNLFITSWSSAAMLVTDGWTYGVIDNNTFNVSDHAINVFESNWGDETWGDGSWASPLALGSDEAVYIEDNIFNTPQTEGVLYYIDSFAGGRYVFRHNIVLDGGVSNHGTESPQIKRSVVSYEVYDNSFVSSPGIISFAPFYVRGGTGVFFNNSITGSWYGMLQLVEFRLTDNDSPWGTCDGTDPFDNNSGVYLTATYNGPLTTNGTFIEPGANWAPNQWYGYSLINLNSTYNWASQVLGNTNNAITTRASDYGITYAWHPGDRYEIAKANECLDQIGMAPGSGPYITGDVPVPVAWPNETLQPFYSWNNTIDGVSQNNNSAKVSVIGYTIQLNRNYYLGIPRPGYTPYIFPYPGTASAQGSSYSLSVSTTGSGFGIVSCSGTYCPSSAPAGANFVIIANPSPLATFNGWSGACASYGISLVCYVKMSGPQFATANFGLAPGISTTTSTTSTTTTTSSIPTTSIISYLNIVSQLAITLTNNQIGSTGNNFQQRISFNPSNAAYASYEAADLGNIRFMQGSTQLPSWCERGCSSSSTNAIFWVKVPNINGASSISINMTLLSKGTEYDGFNAGEAPNQSASYAKYDNGYEVFGVYSNFVGSSIPSSYIKIANAGSSIIVNNGINFSVPGGFAAVTYNATFLPNTVFEFHAPSMSAYPAGLILMNSTTPQPGYSNNGYCLINSAHSVYPCSAGIGQVGTNFDNPAIAATSGIVGGAWLSSSSQVWYVGGIAYAGSQTLYPLSGSVQPEFGITNYGANTNLYVDWFRSRSYPPGGIMPSASFGALTLPSTTLSTISSTTIASSASTTTAQIGPSGGGSGGGSSGGGSLRPVVSYSNSCFTITNMTQSKSANVTFGSEFIGITVNFISLSSAGVTVNGQPYLLYTSNSVSLQYGNGENYSMVLKGISYLPILHTITLQLCNSSSTQYSTSSSAYLSVLQGGKTSSILINSTNTTVPIDFWPGNITLSSASAASGSLFLQIENASSSIQNLPYGYSPVMALSLNLSGSNATVVDATLNYNCGIGAASIYPYVQITGGWRSITNFSVNRAKCQIRFLAPANGTVALLTKNATIVAIATPPSPIPKSNIDLAIFAEGAFALLIVCIGIILEVRHIIRRKKEGNPVQPPRPPIYSVPPSAPPLETDKPEIILPRPRDNV